MGTISRSVKAGGSTNITAGQTAVASDVNTDMNTVFNEVNGSLDHNNVQTAMIPGAKSFRFTGIATPSNPASGDLLLYATTAPALAILDEAGNVSVIGSGGGSGRGEVTNLSVVHDGTNPAFKVSITADAIDIEGDRATSVSVSADLTASGAGGLDSGSEAANTHYYIWVIRKSSDGTVNGLFSTSSSAPTMPAGYDQKRLISHRRNNNSSNLIRAVQSNDLVLGDYTDMQVASTISSSTDLDVSPFVPPAIAAMCLFRTRLGSGVEWAFDDKDDSTIRYALIASNGDDDNGIWARVNASGVVTATEVSGASNFSAWLIGWRVRVL